MNPRPYQSDAVAKTIEAWQTHSSALVVMPTGTGKTVVFSLVTEIRKAAGRVMVVAHREELINQAADKIQKVTGEVAEIEMADRRADTHMFNRAKVIVSSIQTQIAGKPKRMTRFNPKEFGLLIVDEAHHATAASYQEVIKYYKEGNPNLKVLGVTATPDRADEAALGQIFECVPYVYEITQAIKDGYLVPIHARSVLVEGLDYSKVRTTAGDLNGKDLADVMSNEEVLQQIVDAGIRECGSRKTIVFAPPGFKKDGGDAFRVSERLTEIFNRHRPECARLVSQDTPKDLRAQIFKDFANGRFQFLVNVGIATEGFDDPGIEVVVLARPTESRSLFTQMVGRGTRPLPGLVDGVESASERCNAIAASPKPACEVLDFVGVCGKHKLVTVADILGGKYGDDVKARASKKAQEGTVDTAAALEESAAEIEQEKLEAQRREAARRAAIKGKARYKTQSVDPFDVLAIEPNRDYGMTHAAPATPSQIQALIRFGISDADNLTKSKASQLLIECHARRKAGLCSYKQAKILQKRGLSSDCSFDMARELIDEIAAKEGWGQRQKVSA